MDAPDDGSCSSSRFCCWLLMNKNTHTTIIIITLIKQNHTPKTPMEIFGSFSRIHQRTLVHKRRHDRPLLFLVILILAIAVWWDVWHVDLPLKALFLSVRSLKTHVARPRPRSGLLTHFYCRCVHSGFVHVDNSWIAGNDRRWITPHAAQGPTPGRLLIVISRCII